MANKINWQKHRLQDKARKGFYQADKYVGKEHTWLLKGEHTFKKVRDLPVNYLIWASENLSAGEHKEKADKELIRRYNKISNT